MPSAPISPASEIQQFPEAEAERYRNLLSEEDRQKTFDLVSGALSLFTPKERLNIWQWAERFRYVAKGVSAKTLEGPRLYCSSDAPHQRAPQESPTDPNVQVTVLVMASQIGGKTEIFNNTLGYFMHWVPSSSVVMYPTLDAAEKYSKKKFTPMVEASPVLTEIIKPARDRDSGNTILIKDFRGGSVFFVGSNSTTSLRGASGGVLLGDEIDSNEDSAGNEGDSIELLFKRAESFPNAVKLLASTPTIKGLSRIWSWFELSDQQYWFVPCAKCGHWHTFKWSQVQWPKGKPAEAVLLCPSCAAALNDKQRLDMYFAGEWRPTAPFNGIRGFHLNGIYVPWPAQKGFQNRLHQMAEEFLRAEKGGDTTKQVWVNTFLCELWESQTEKIDHHKLLERIEDYGPDKVPEGVILVLAGIDVQKRWIQCETVGLGFDDETWGIESVKFEGDTEQDDVWQSLSDHLSKKYKRADGIELPITASAIDMRHKPHKVRALVQKGGIARVFPVYGVHTSASPILVTTRLNKHYRLRTFAIATRIAKDAIYARLKVEDPGPRYMHFPKGNGYNEDYFEGLTAEVLKTKKVRGVTVQTYEKVFERNEPLDIRVYFTACIDILKPALTAIAKHMKPVGEKKDYELKPSTPTPQNTTAAPEDRAQKALEKKPPQMPGKPDPDQGGPGRRKIRVGGMGGGWKI